MKTKKFVLAKQDMLRRWYIMLQIYLCVGMKLCSFHSYQRGT